MAHGTLSHWRLRAREVIEEALVGVDRHDVAAVKRAIDAAYPFGERAMWPYRMWLVERRAALAAASAGLPSCACRACGAGPGKPCRDIVTHEVCDPHATRTGEPVCLLCGALPGEGCRGGEGLCAPEVRRG